MRKVLLIIFIIVWAGPVTGQVCSDCSIGVPRLAEPNTVGAPTILSIPRTGLETDCTGNTTDPQWSVTGQAQILAGAQSDTVLLSASGPYELTLESETAMWGPQSCTMVSGTNVAVNPDFSPQCGLNIIMVLDESNSISAPEEEVVRQAVRGFASGLIGSGSRMSVVEFGTRAETEIPGDCSLDAIGSPHYFTIDAASVSGCLEDYLVNDYGTTSSGGTNWDDALRKVNDVIEQNTVQPDIVIFFTDGNPTYYIDEYLGDMLGGSGSVTTSGSMNHAIAEANSVKSAAHLLVVGVGDQVNLGNIKMISGLDEYTGDLATADFLYAEDFDSLAGSFFDIALEICGTSLYIENTGPECTPAEDLNMEYHIAFGNEGSQAAREVVITNVIPTGFDIVSQTRNPMAGTVERVGDRFTWDLGDLAAGQVGTWTFVLSGQAASEYLVDLACISASNHEAGPDDTASVQTMINTLNVFANLQEPACGATNGSIDLDVSGGTPPYEYEWSTGTSVQDLSGLGTGQYEVIVTDAAGCTYSGSYDLDPVSSTGAVLPVLVSLPDECSSAPAVLQVHGGFPNVQWYFGDNAIPGAVDTVLYAYEGGVYSATGLNADGCIAAASAPVAVDVSGGIPDPAIEQEGSLQCGMAGGVLLTAGDGYAAYSWQLEGLVLEGETSTQLQASEPGVYTLQVANAAGCTAEAEIIVQLETPPVRTESVTVDLLETEEGHICLGPDILQSGGGAVASVYSCTGVGSASFGYSLDGPSVCLEIATGSMTSAHDTICLVTCSSLECMPCDTTYLLLAGEADDDPPVYTGECRIPDVITPNGDGWNELFVIECIEDVQQLQLEVYNRWGNQVFRRESYLNDWDGTYRGRPLPEGTYYYIIRFEDADGREYRKAGDLTILR